MKKWLFVISGSKEQFTLEHRVFNSASFFITLFAFLASASNYFVGLHINTVWPGFLGGFMSLGIFYLTRIKQIFASWVVMCYIAMTVIFMGGIYFYNAASEGTIIYLILMLLTIILLIVPPSLQVPVFIILYGTVMILLTLECFNPEWIVKYDTRGARLIDHGITIFYSALFSSIVVVLFRTNYINERKQVQKQNDDLLELNRKIDDQKVELEKSVVIANERNERIQILLKELHHRVKNNLQVISSLLALQSNRLEDDVARQSLESSRTRIEAMALIHKSLYQNEDMSAVEIGAYLESLINSITDSFGFDKRSVHTQVDLKNPLIDIDLAIPVGLIVNELVTNSFKHAFHGIKEPQVKVSVKQDEGNIINLKVEDNGTGINTGTDLKRSGSFGMKLVFTLLDQLDANMRIENHQGTLFIISIPSNS